MRRLKGFLKMFERNRVEPVAIDGERFYHSTVPATGSKCPVCGKGVVAECYAPKLLGLRFCLECKHRFGYGFDYGTALAHKIYGRDGEG
jgi:hypothetical protein